MMTLAEYLASVRVRRWKIGVLDCSVFMADWVREVTGRDPIADVRGRYSTERQMWKIVRAEGGFEVACAARLAAVGMRETNAPKDGDILTVLAPYAERRGKYQVRPVGSICIGGMHAVVTPDLGIVFAGNDRLPLVKAWTF